MNNLAVIFPGQGCQYIGMGRELYERYEIVRSTFEEASDSVKVDLKKLCFDSTIGELTKTENAQPVILTLSVAAFRVLTNMVEINPKYLAGHSLGEISALVCSNAINFSDGVKLVKARGRFMQESINENDGVMLAINGVDCKIIEEECDKYYSEHNIVSISNYNSYEQTVISGAKDIVTKVGQELESKGAHVIPLNVSAPFHCEMMLSASEKFRKELFNYKFNSLKYKVISNVNAFPYFGIDNIIDILSKQIVSPVQWNKSMLFLRKEGVDLVINMGPGNVLENIARRNYPQMDVASFDRDGGITNISSKIKKGTNLYNLVEVDGKKLIERCLAVAVCSPNYNEDIKQYEEGVSNPYKKIKDILDNINLNKKQADFNDMELSINKLISIFKFKKISPKEQTERLKKLLLETGTYDLFSAYIPS